MARARNIKPGFFKNEDLAECQPFARLCFAGLWTMADREGRLEDRPKRIKAELFAYDSVEVEPLLKELQRHGFLDRYIVGDLSIIQILHFDRHQTPHFKEPPSVLPTKSLGLDPHSMTSKPEALPPLNEQQTPDKAGAGPPSKGTKAEEKLGETEIHPTLKGGSEPPDTGYRIPDTGVNTSGTSYPHPSAVRLNGSQAAGLPKPECPPDCPHRRIRDLWAELMPELQQPAKWSEARATALRSRWREEATEHHWASEDDGLQFFAKLFRWCRKSDFLMGRTTPKPGHAAFAVTVPWLIKAENWAKVQEGNYHAES